MSDCYLMIRNAADFKDKYIFTFHSKTMLKIFLDCPENSYDNLFNKDGDNYELYLDIREENPEPYADQFIIDNPYDPIKAHIDKPISSKELYNLVDRTVDRELTFYDCGIYNESINNQFTSFKKWLNLPNSKSYDVSIELPEESIYSEEVYCSLMDCE